MEHKTILNIKKIHTISQIYSIQGDKYLFCGLPFVVSLISAQGMLNDNHYCKIIGFGIVFILMLLLTLIKNYANTHKCIELHTIDACIFLLLALYISHSLGTHNVLDHNLPILYIAFYFFLRLSLEKSDYWTTLTNIVLVIIPIHLTICGLQLLSILPNHNSYFNIGSTFGNPDMLAAYLAILLPINYKGENFKAFRITTSILTILLFFLLQARTAIVATIAILLWNQLSNRTLNGKKIFIGILFFVIGCALLAFWHIDSFSGRIFVWIASTCMMFSKPGGWGLYSFERHYPEFQANFATAHPLLSKSLNVDIVHSPYNEFLYVGVTLGILGFILYTLIVIYTIKTAYKTKFFESILIYQIISLAYFPFKIVPLTIVYILLCALVFNSTSGFNIKVKTKTWKNFNGVLLFSILLCLACITYSFQQWKQATSGTQQINHTAYKNSYVFLRGNGRFLASYAEFCYKNGDTDKAFILMKEAENYFLDIAFLHNLATLYEQNGLVAEAQKQYDLATEICPNNANIAFAKIQFLKRNGKEKEASQFILLWKEKLLSNKLKEKYKIAAKKICNTESIATY